MTTKTTTIAGFSVTLDTDMDGDGNVTGCWIEHGDYSASLEAADATATLTDGDGCETAIGAATIAKVRAWAEANGY